MLSDDSRPPRVSIRDGKNQVVSEVAAVAAGRGIRFMRGGGSVFAHHGLISPGVARFAALIVDPFRLAELRAALQDSGWRPLRPPRLQVLPPTITTLERDGFDGTLNLYGVIPGFFVGAQEAFEILWKLRDETTPNGPRVPILGKLPTVMFAAHNRLGGQRFTRQSEMHFNYFLAQFRGALSVGERLKLQSLARSLGAEDEVRRMLDGLDLELHDAATPSEGYVSARVGLDHVTRADAWAITVVERPRGRRAAFPGVVAASGALLRLLGARRRLGV